MHWSNLHRHIIREPSTTAALLALDTILTDIGSSRAVNIKDSLGWTPLSYALWSFPEAVEPLLRAGATTWLVNLPLYYASESGGVAAVSPLIRAGADINEPNKYGDTPLHISASPDTQRYPKRYDIALELVRHGGHIVNWDAPNKSHRIPLDYAKMRAEQTLIDEDSTMLLDLYSTRQLPHGGQYIGLQRIVEAPADGDSDDLSTSLIRAGLHGDVEAIGDMIRAGAMVNEVDEDGLTLLHLVAFGRCALNGYRVAVELVRHGGYGVHWDATTVEGKTALDLVAERIVNDDLDPESRKEADNMLSLLTTHRLPPGESYIFPCMDPEYCKHCSLNPCGCGKRDFPDLPGSYVP